MTISKWWHIYDIVCGPDKRGSSETSTTETTSTATAEETSEPVQHVETPSDEKGSDFAELLAEREALLQEKDEIIKELQDKVLRAYAEVENVKAEAESDECLYWVLFNCMVLNWVIC